MISHTETNIIPQITAKNRIARAVWALVWTLLFRPSPVPMHRWRGFLLTLFGARLNRKVFIYPSAQIWAPWNLEMGNKSCLASRVQCYNVALVRLGSGVTISQGTHLCTASHNFDIPEFPLIGAPIEIGAGAWVAADAFVGPGVTIGDHAVVLARAVLVRDAPAGMVMGGNPAKTIRKRSQFWH